MNTFTEQREYHVETIRASLRKKADTLQNEWSNMSSWLTRDAYQDGAHVELSHNKKRNAWFVQVFELSRSALQSGVLAPDESEHIVQQTEELKQAFRREQAEGGHRFTAAVLPGLTTYCESHGIQLPEQMLPLLAIQLAKDPTGHIASQTVLVQGGSHPFETESVVINTRLGVTQEQSQGLAASFANFAKESNIEALREYMGNSDELVQQGDALLGLIRTCMQPDERYETTISDTHTTI